MAVFEATAFLAIVTAAKNELYNISKKYVEKNCGVTAAKEFNKACESLDSNTANKIISDTFCKISGKNSVSSAVDSLVMMFPEISELQEDFSGKYYDKDKLKAVNKYTDRMLAVIRNNWQNN